jgi:putative addiction module component (TIGR02574 family)
MDISDTIHDLRPAEKLRLFEQIWDDLAANATPLPLPDWAEMEATRRRDEMLADVHPGSTHKEIWKRIYDSRNG